MKKLVFTLVFVVCCSVFVSATSEAAQFKDVSKKSSYYEAVNVLSNEGIIKGKQANIFAPNDTLTRAQAAKMIVLSLDMKQSKNASSFKDIKASSSYLPYIETLASEKIINGYKDGTFKPNETITKRQLAKIVANAYHLNSVAADMSALPFNDVKKGSEEERFVKMLYKAGVISKASKYNGHKKVTRGEFAQIIYLAQQAAVMHEDLKITHSDENYVYTSIGALKYSDAIEMERLSDEFSVKIRRGEIIAVTDGYTQKVLLPNNKITVSGKDKMVKGQLALNYADLGVEGIATIEVHPNDVKKVTVQHALQKSYNYCDYSAPIIKTKVSTGDYYTLDAMTKNQSAIPTKLTTADYYTGKVNNQQVSTPKSVLSTKDLQTLKSDSIGLSTKDYKSSIVPSEVSLSTKDYMSKVSMGQSVISTKDIADKFVLCNDLLISPYDQYFMTGLQANSVARVLVTAYSEVSEIMPQYIQFELYVKVDRHKDISIYYK